MADFAIEQVLLYRGAEGEPTVQARSPGVVDDWLPFLKAQVYDFGQPAGGERCPAAVFAQPLGGRHVAIVHVSDAVAARTLAFHALILPRRAYEDHIANPFRLAAQLPPQWSALGTLPTVTWPAEPLQPPTIAEVQAILQRVKSAALPEDVPIAQDTEEEADLHNAEGPALLGGVQVLVDGGRLIFARPAPATDFLAALWTLLPFATRAQLWPASYAFSTALPFDIVVLPRLAEEGHPGYTTEEQALDYPTGSYELGLQTAAEAGDQEELNALYARRSLQQTWKLALALLGVMMLAVALSNLMKSETPVRLERPEKQAMIAAALVGTQQPLPLTVMLPAAQEAWNKLNEEAEQR